MKIKRSCKLLPTQLCINFPGSDLRVTNHPTLINGCDIVWNKNIAENAGYNLWYFFLSFSL